MEGGHRFPLTIENIYGTCFIDSVLNSVANSDPLSNHFKSILPESEYSDETILEAFDEGMKHHRVVSAIVDDKYDVDDKITLLYEILVSIFIRGINKYDETTLICVRLYLMYLENFQAFNEHYRSKTKFITCEEESFHDLACKADYNFVQYFQYCQKALKRKNQDIKFTGVSSDKFLDRIQIEVFPSTLSTIYNKIRKIAGSDIYIRILHDPSNKQIIPQVFDACIKHYDCDYRCSDVVLDKYKKGELSPIHSVFYNLDHGKLHDNSKIIDIGLNRLAQPSEDRVYYFPSILHFQLKSSENK